MSDFSKQVTRHLTPLLKLRGFSKSGTFSGSPLHDAAVYEGPGLRVVVALQLHPADYPDVGVLFEIQPADSRPFRKLYELEDGDTPDLISRLCRDIQSNKLPHLPF